MPDVPIKEKSQVESNDIIFASNNDVEVKQLIKHGLCDTRIFTNN